MALADLNHDGRDDLVLCSSGGNAVIVLLSVDGRLQDGKLALHIAAGQAPSGLVVADFNTDGHPDVAIADAGDNTISVLLGHGDGSFDLPRGFMAGLRPAAIAVADVDGDGLPDVVLADRNSGQIAVLRNLSH